MGISLSSNKVNYEVLVKTGDVKGAGTDSNVYVSLIDVKGNRSRDLLLDVLLRDDFQKGAKDKFKIKNVPNLGRIARIEMWRDSKGLGDDWFVEYVKVTPNQQKTGIKQGLHIMELADSDDEFYFPMNRWIQPDRTYKISRYDSQLPQYDINQEQRQKELVYKKECYRFSKGDTGIPKTAEECPIEEHFSNDYKWDIVGRKMKLLAQTRFVKMRTSGKWNSLQDILQIYRGSFDVPKGFYDWDQDWKFGRQRLAGCNPCMLARCDIIPDNFAVTSDMIEPFLDGITLKEAIERKEIFIVNHKRLEGVQCKDNRTLCTPMALFHAKRNGDLLPLAIQLFQQPGPQNPVFLPSDDKYVWLLAKMYFNNADCAYHQAVTHLGFTHLVMESICVCANRELSPSHPVFRLMAPHFLYVLAINSLAVAKLLAPGGWIDITMTTGAAGTIDTLKKCWKDWRMNVEGWLPAELAQRQVDDKEVLPVYEFRDDAISLHTAIYNYVSQVLGTVYDTEDSLNEDHEIQNFAQALTATDGANIKGVFGGGKFNNLDDLKKTLTSILYMASVGHAAANFAQYDEYAFPPNYPALLNGDIPNSKDPITEQEIIVKLPNRETTLSIMVVTKILSDRGTNGLGDFEIQYMYEPRAVDAAEKFKAELRNISAYIKERGKDKKNPYNYLDPEEVPNAISI